MTGSEEAVAAWAAEALRELGLAVEVVSPALADVRADPDWPGEEMPRTSLPVVIGRAGRDDGPTTHPVGSPRRRAAGRPRYVDGRSVGRRRPRRCVVRPRRVRHEGRRGVHPGRRPGAGSGGRPRPSGGCADGRPRTVRGGRRAGHPGGHPGRRQRRSRDHHRAVEPRRRRRPRRRDHLPPDRARSCRPRVAASRGDLGARQAVRAEPGARGGRERAATRPRPIRS